ncbi:MAG: hypothetical protein AAF959_15975 [Cyanobacteria bacterium P01_D01_bin.56]
MNKRQLKQSAMADFMQSLEQLNDLWGSELENSRCEDDSAKLSPANSDKSNSPASASESQASQPETDCQ